MIPELSGLKTTSPDLIFSLIVSLDHLHPFLGGKMVFPLGAVILYRNVALRFGLLTSPALHAPFESLSGFE